MPARQVPNIRVWQRGDDYSQASLALLEQNRVLPAAILAALAAEILLKSFLAEGDNRGKARTQRGHPLIDLFLKLTKEDQMDLDASFTNTDSDIPLLIGLKKFSDLFSEARYF